MVILPDPPVAIVMMDGFAPKVRSGSVELGLQVDVNLTGPEIWLLRVGFPTACTYIT